MSLGLCFFLSFLIAAETSNYYLPTFSFPSYDFLGTTTIGLTNLTPTIVIMGRKV